MKLCQTAIAAQPAADEEEEQVQGNSAGLAVRQGRRA